VARVHVHTRAVLALQLLESGFGIGVDRKCRCADVRLGAASGEALDLANSHASAGDPASDGEASLGIVNGKQRASVTGGDTAFLKQDLDWLFELEEADSIGDCGAVLAGALGDLFLREMKFVDKALKGVRLLDGVEIFALEIFHQRHLQSHLFRDVSDDDWDAQ